MAHYNTLLHQLLSLLPRHQFQKRVESSGADSYTKSFSTWNQLTVLLYAQASGKDSLRDIEHSLLAQSGRTYHVGLPARICRSTLADAGARRDWRVFEGLFYQLLERCQSVTPKHKFRVKSPLFSQDATVISLCLAAFPWARYRTAKGAIKLHCQLDHAGHIPCMIRLTDGKGQDLTVFKQEFPLVPDSIYVIDRAYIDFAYFRRMQEMGCTFITRLKSHIAYRVIGQHKELTNRAVLSDERIERTAANDGTLPLRLIRYYDKEKDVTLEFLTNNLALAATTIAALYKARWQVEIFFRWIKQNLKIQTFLGTSQNAVWTQIWVGMIYYLLLSYIKYQTKCSWALTYLHRLIRATLLDPMNLIDLVHLSPGRINRLRRLDPQLTFNFSP